MSEIPKAIFVSGGSTEQNLYFFETVYDPIIIMVQWKELAKKIFNKGTDDNFLRLIDLVENIVSKVLSIALLVIMVVSLVDLVIFLAMDIFTEPVGFFNQTIIELFGLFLNILITLELMENITGYLKQHIVQVELVIITSLIAVARKIIIFDFDNYSSLELMALAVAILALSGSYWLIRRTTRNRKR